MARGFPAQAIVFRRIVLGLDVLDGLEQQAAPGRIIVDSTPSRLSDYGCPAEFDPVNHLPQDASNFLFIAGHRDGVVSPSMSRELLETAQQRGAEILRDKEFGHPFMDHDRSVHRRRMQLIEKYLLYGEKS